jgi:pimeloyl-ACP methyl ester carboxylesterase
MPTASINGVELYYETHGSGTPLMLVAGLASDSQSWQPVLDTLCQQYSVIAFDNRGVGRTRADNAEISIPRLADDCIALKEHLGLPAVHLLGHSMGGFVALDCALRYPQHLRNLILVGSSANNSARNHALFRDWVAYLEAGMDPSHWFRNLFYWIFSKGFFDDTHALSEALRLAIDYPYPQSTADFKQQVAAINAFDCLHALSSISTRTLVLCGKEDLLFPADESMTVLGAIPGADIHVIEQAAHAVHMENPHAFTDHVFSFLGNS